MTDGRWVGQNPAGAEHVSFALPAGLGEGASMGVDSRASGDKSGTKVSPDVDVFDAIVVGSGFGGAVTACRLAQAEFRVAVVERGRRYESADFPNLPGAAALVPDFRRWTWQHDQGLWDVVDLEEVVSVQAAGYGGGSLIYANVHLRPPAAVFDAQWPTRYRDPKYLEEYFDLAASMLDVAPVTAYPEFEKKLIKADQLKRAADALGREADFFHPPLAIRYEPEELRANEHGVEQGGCKSCGSCCTGCPHKAKNTLDFNYLAVAERRRAEVFTQCEVVDLEPAPQGGWRVHAYDHLQASRVCFRAKYVFLCAGSIHTTRLLARAKKVPDETRALVGVGYFPGGDALGVVYDTKHPQHPSSGPTITTTTVQWESTGPGSFFLIQDGGYAVELDRLVGIFRSGAWLDRNRLSEKNNGALVGRTSGKAADVIGAVAPGLPLPSPLDAVLDAIQDGELDGVMSEKQRSAFEALRNRLNGPTLLPDVVRETMEGDLRDKIEHGAILSVLPKFLARAYVLVIRGMAHRVFGTDARLARYALKALTTAAGLPRDRVGKDVFGYDDKGAVHRTMLLAMGRDAASGVLHYDEDNDRLIADLDLFGLAPGYAGEEGLMNDIARALGGELRTNPAWAFLGKPVTVHNQGGCRMSDHPEDGVATPLGEVRGCEGLFVADGSLLCTSVGVNPSATIAAIVEHNILAFIRKVRSSTWPEGDLTDGAKEYAEHRARATTWAARAEREKWALTPPRAPGAEHRRVSSLPLGVEFDEAMNGYYAEADKEPVFDKDFRDLEAKGRPSSPIGMNLHVDVDNLAAFFEDDDHRMAVSGDLTLKLPGGAVVERCTLSAGTLELFVPRTKAYAIEDVHTLRRKAQTRIAGAYRATRRAGPRDRERRLNYDLSFADARGRRWRLLGFKRVRTDPAVDAWRDTSSLFVTLYESRGEGDALSLSVRGGGVAHVEATAFLFDQLPSVQAKRCNRRNGVPDVAAEHHEIDPGREAWAVASFSAFFFGSLQRIYAPEVSTAIDSLFHPRHHVHPRPARTAPRP